MSPAVAVDLMGIASIVLAMFGALVWAWSVDRQSPHKAAMRRLRRYRP